MVFWMYHQFHVKFVYIYKQTANKQILFIRSESGKLNIRHFPARPGLPARAHSGLRVSRELRPLLERARARFKFVASALPPLSPARSAAARFKATGMASS